MTTIFWLPISNIPVTLLFVDEQMTVIAENIVLTTFDCTSQNLMDAIQHLVCEITEDEYFDEIFNVSSNAIVIDVVA